MKISINISVLALLISLGVLGLFSFKTYREQSQEIEFMQMSVIESVVSGGAGRSRMITINDKGEMKEEKLENFFSVTGINFRNVRFNDNMITERISKYTNEGWILDDVSTGVYGGNKGTGIFLTRYIFKRNK